MNGASSPIPLEKKQNVRRDFVLGRGSIRTLAKRYGVANGTIQKWVESEDWTAARDLFASQDELTECKKQIVQLNAAIEAAGHNPDALHKLTKSKQTIVEEFFRLTLWPRCPIAKPEKRKSNELTLRLEAAARTEATATEREPTDGGRESSAE